MGLTNAASYTLHDFRIGAPQFRLLGDEVAVLANNVHEELTVEGKHGVSERRSVRPRPEELIVWHESRPQLRGADN